MSVISFWDVWYPTNSMAEWSALESESYMLPWWPQQTIHSASFHPLSAVCRNISCNIMVQCGVPSPHQGYSSKKAQYLSDALPLKLTCHSLWQNPGQPRSFALSLHDIVPTRLYNWRYNKDVLIHYSPNPQPGLAPSHPWYMILKFSTLQHCLFRQFSYVTTPSL